MNLDFSWLQGAKWGKGCFVEDYLLLAGLVYQYKPARILEIGTSMGLGAIVLAQAALQFQSKAKVWTVDRDQRHGRDNIDLVPGIAEYIEFVEEDSVTWLWQRRSEGKRFDFAFIDGDHSYEAASKDWSLTRRMTDVIVFHDTTQFTGLQKLMYEIGEMPEYDIVQLVSAPGHRVKPGMTREQFITGMTIVQNKHALYQLSGTAHRDDFGKLLPGHSERVAPGIEGMYP